MAEDFCDDVGRRWKLGVHTATPTARSERLEDIEVRRHRGSDEEEAYIDEGGAWSPRAGVLEGSWSSVHLSAFDGVASSMLASSRLRFEARRRAIAGVFAFTIDEKRLGIIADGWPVFSNVSDAPMLTPLANVGNGGSIYVFLRIKN